jgi:SP family sugar:H+ symporter-like MFS transporter
MQDEGYGNLQGKVGFVYGSFSVIAAVWVTFVLPEMKDRALEELDEMFAQGVSTFQFGRFRTEGLGAAIIGVERSEVDGSVPDKVMHAVDVKAVKNLSV